MTQQDAISLLVEDHREVEEMFGQLEALPTGSSAGETALHQRRDLVDKITSELSRHAAVEEMHLYPFMKQVLPDGDAKVAEAIEEHQQAKNVLDELDGMSPTDPQFEPDVRQLMTDIRHHVREEEDDLFAELRRQASPDDLRELGRKLADAKATAPTRPHPHAPNEPPFNKVAGPAGALLDKARDAVTGRKTT